MMHILTWRPIFSRCKLLYCQLPSFQHNLNSEIPSNCWPRCCCCTGHPHWHVLPLVVKSCRWKACSIEMIPFPQCLNSQTKFSEGAATQAWWTGTRWNRSARTSGKLKMALIWSPTQGVVTPEEVTIKNQKKEKPKGTILVRMCSPTCRLSPWT